MQDRTGPRSARAAVVVWCVAAGLACPAVASAERLYTASLRNGAYGGGFIVDTFSTYCSDPDGSSCGDGNLSEIGITNSPDGVVFTNRHAAINFPIGRDFPARLSGFRARGTVSVWFRASRASHVAGQPFTDNYGFDQFNSGQGAWGASMSRHLMNTPDDTSDDMVQVGWGTWHDNVWYYHVPAGTVLLSYDEWHHLGFVWGGPDHDVELWVDGQLRASRNLPAGVTKSWGSQYLGRGSGYNFALGEIHERIVGNSTVYGVTFADLAIWDEARPLGDYPLPPAPTVTAILPSSGPTTGGTAVRISGADLLDADVTIGGTAAPVVSSQPGELVVTAPPGVAGARDVVVTTLGGTVTATGGFTYLAEARIADLGTRDVSTRQPALDHHGRYLAFVSSHPALVAGDTNGVDDVFVYDRATRTIVRVSVGTGGDQANGPSYRPSLSASGRFVAFVSEAANLVPGDTNGAEDVFLHDRDADDDGVFDEPQACSTIRVSVATTGEQANGGSRDPDLSTEGRWIAFVSSASNLVAGDRNGADDVFLHHWPSGLTMRASVATGGAEANGHSSSPSVSAGGVRVVFASDATNLVTGDTNGQRDVFMHERPRGATVRVSSARGTNGQGDANGPSDRPSIDDAGNVLAFQTQATDIVDGTPAPRWQVVMFTLVTATGGPVRSPGLVAEAAVDIGAAIRHLISANGQGQGGNGDSTNADVSGDGIAAAFDSRSSDLVPGDGNDEPDVFVAAVPAPAQPAPPRRVSLDAWGNEGAGTSREGAISGDGRVVAFESTAGLTVGTVGSSTTSVFVRGQRLLVSRILPDFAAAGADTGAVIDGAGFTDGVQVRFGALAPTGVVRESDSRIVVGQLPMVATPQALDVIVTTVDGEQVRLMNGFHFTAAAPAVDTDGDGLPDDWEIAHGLDANSATGANGADGDPDGDGVPNLAERTNATHPRGTYARYLAEGATGDFFATRVALANPSPSVTARALLRFQKRVGGETAHVLTVPPLESRAVAINDVAGMAQAEFATLVESDVPLVVDRGMSWDRANGYGMHAERALNVSSLTWYLAEGATHSGFDLFYLLQNPSNTDAKVRIRYLLPSAPELVKAYTVPAFSRSNVWVDHEEFPDGSGNLALADTDVSAVIDVTNGVPIIVERAMYLSRGGQFFGAGHESAGVTAPALNWFLAEGATGTVFDLFLLFANPNATPATARVSYLLETGETLTREITVEPNSRRNIWVDYDTPDGTTGLPLLDAALSTKVEVLNGVPIIVERAMWWPVGPDAWYEAHSSPGSTVTGTLWGIANGENSGPPANRTTYVLIANTSVTTADARVTLLFDGAPASSPYAVSIAPGSRRTIDIGQAFPESAGRTFGVLVESVGETPAQIAVECAVYQDAAGAWWAAGGNQLATRLR